MREERQKERTRQKEWVGNVAVHYLCKSKSTRNNSTVRTRPRCQTCERIERKSEGKWRKKGYRARY